MECGIEAIVRAVRTGNVGDGELFVLPAAEALGVRTGERGEIFVGEAVC